MSLFDSASRPLVIGHRGASARAPENTLAAFDLALAEGVDLIEFDVHLSADDQPVIIHDETLDRTTDGGGPVRARTLGALKRLDAGRWYGPAFRGQRLPSVSEVLERYRGRSGFAIEVKAGSALNPGIEDRIVSLVEEYDVVDATLILSFDRAALATVGARNPELRRVLLVDARTDWAAAPPPASALGVAVGIASARRIRAIRTTGLAVYVWTVNDVATLDRLIALGVTGLITDTPALARSRLA